MRASLPAFGAFPLNKPQCSDMYTQAQVEDSDCIVGANIGLGLLMLFAAALTVPTLIAAGIIIWPTGKTCEN